MRALLICVFLCCRLIGAHGQSDTLVIEVEQGLLRGYRDEGIFTFMNVPYARAPTGVKRFKPPEQVPAWNDTFNAVDRGIMCPQPNQSPNTQEDCLVANIFMPDTNVTNLPVMIDVHGGAYVIGSGSLRYTELAKTKKVVIVTFNYRLGAHGFLCLGTEDIPGNAGMKDQVALLRWVNKNIAKFGGNPHDVTIHGCSAGGSAVDFLTLSPMTKGLFHKVSIASGVCLAALGTQIDPTQNAKDYAEFLNFTNVDNIDALEEFYKTIPIELLTSTYDRIENYDDSDLLFTPCVERSDGIGEKFLLDTPWNILKTGNYSKLPILYGYTDMEGLRKYPRFDKIRERMTQNFSNFLPADLQFETDEKKEQVAYEVRRFYFRDSPVDTTTILGFIDYYTDILFAYPMLRALKMRRSVSGDTVFLYEYSFVDENTQPVGTTTVRGADHCAQLYAIRDEDTTNATTDYLNMKKRMREIWLNFITSGSPEATDLPTWLPVSNSWSPSMALRNESQLTTISILDRALFWEKIYNEHYRDSIPPSMKMETSL